MNSNGYTEVFAWGCDHNGQMGLAGKKIGKNYTIPRFCSFNVIIHQISCGNEHSAFIASNGYIYTMGNNKDGKLGINPRVLQNSTSPCLVDGLSKYKAVKVSCGYSHTAAVLENGELYTWGNASSGQLGLNSNNSQCQPMRVEFFSLNGYPLNIIITDVSCGSRHTIASSRSGEVFTFGEGEHGQLGTNSKKNEHIPIRINTLSEPIKQISAGEEFSLFLSYSGKVYSCGNNENGQLGLGNKKNVLIPTQIQFLNSINIKKIAGNSYSAAISENGELYIWGTGPFGEHAFPTKVLSNSKGNFIDLSVGYGFGCVIDNIGGILTWGSNTQGELGTGDYETKAAPTKIQTLAGKKVTQVSCGNGYAMALGTTIQQQQQQQQQSIHKLDEDANNTELLQQNRKNSRSPLKSSIIHSSGCSNQQINKKSEIAVNFNYDQDEQDSLNSQRPNGNYVTNNLEIINKKQIPEDFNNNLSRENLILRNTINELKFKLQVYESHKQTFSFNESIQSSCINNNEIVKELTKEKEKNNQLRKQLDKIQQQHYLLQDKFSDLNTLKHSLEQSVERVKLLENELEHTKTYHEHTIQQINNEKNELREQLEYDIVNKEQQIMQITTKLRNIEQIYNEQVQLYQQIQNELYIKNNQFIEIQNTNDNDKILIEKLQRDHEDYKIKIQRYDSLINSKTDLEDKYNTLQAKLKDKDNEIQQLNEEINFVKLQSQILVQDKTNQIHELDQNLLYLNNQIHSLSEKLIIEQTNCLEIQAENQELKLECNTLKQQMQINCQQNDEFNDNTIHKITKSAHNIIKILNHESTNNNIKYSNSTSKGLQTTELILQRNQYQINNNNNKTHLLVPKILDSNHHNNENVPPANAKVHFSELQYNHKFSEDQNHNINNSSQQCDQHSGDMSSISVNLNEIKSKLTDLQQNKSFLEQRMSDFEKKLKESKKVQLR